MNEITIDTHSFGHAVQDDQPECTTLTLSVSTTGDPGGERTPLVRFVYPHADPMPWASDVQFLGREGQVVFAAAPSGDKAKADNDAEEAGTRMIAEWGDGIAPLLRSLLGNSRQHASEVAARVLLRSLSVDMQAPLDEPDADDEPATDATNEEPRHD